MVSGGECWGCRSEIHRRGAEDTEKPKNSANSASQASWPLAIVGGEGRDCTAEARRTQRKTTTECNKCVS